MMALLEIQNLHAYYGNVQAVKGLSLTVHEGEIVALIGANGAGKSTILRAISGLLHTEGSVRFDGEEIGQPTERGLPLQWQSTLREMQGFLSRLIHGETGVPVAAGIALSFLIETVLSFVSIAITCALLGGLTALILLLLGLIWPAVQESTSFLGGNIPYIGLWISLAGGVLGGFSRAVHRLLERLQVRPRVPPHEIVYRGVCHVPEGRKVFTTLTVQENLSMGAYTLAGDTQAIERNRQRVYALFPRLAERKHQLAGTLSGGEQQMLAIGRGLMTNPRLLMLDEPSLGLAPMLVRAIFQTIREVSKQGVTILLVEQNARAALRLADRAYVLETGRISLSGPARDLLRDERVRRAYLGEK